MREVFKIYSRAIIQNDNNEFLIVKHNKNQKYWSGEIILPGGPLLFGEEMTYSLLKELKSDLNLDVNGYTLYEIKKYIFGNEHIVVFYYSAYCKDTSTLTNLKPEIYDFCKFLPFDSIEDCDDKEIILRFLRGIRI